MLPLLSMLQIVNKFSEVETYFRKLSFWSNKFVKQILLTQNLKKLKKIFAVVTIDTLVEARNNGKKLQKCRLCCKMLTNLVK
jgi:hypothetical protein